eukprot:876944-Rhodomonas_salina.1
MQTPHVRCAFAGGGPRAVSRGRTRTRQQTWVRTLNLTAPDGRVIRRGGAWCEDRGAMQLTLCRELRLGKVRCSCKASLRVTVAPCAATLSRSRSHTARRWHCGHCDRGAPPAAAAARRRAVRLLELQHTPTTADSATVCVALCHWSCKTVTGRQ